MRAADRLDGVFGCLCNGMVPNEYLQLPKPVVTGNFTQVFEYNLRMHTYAVCISMCIMCICVVLVIVTVVSINAMSRIVFRSMCEEVSPDLGPGLLRV